MLAAARAALGRGDPSACVTLVERALESGAPAVALRVKGDCLLRAGRRAEAITAYRRFCQLEGDHPAIGEVRGIVEGLGSTCP